MTKPAFTNSCSKSPLRTAWNLFTVHWFVFIATELAMLGAWLVLEIAVVSVQKLNVTASIGWAIWLALHLIFLRIFAGLTLGLHSMALQIVDRGTPTMSSIFTHRPAGSSYLLAFSVYWVGVIVGLCIFILPGILLAVRWCFFRQILASQPSSGRTALHKAALLADGHWWPIFRLVLMTVALNIAGAALLGIGFFVSYPVTALWTALFYRTLPGTAKPLRRLSTAHSEA